MTTVKRADLVLEGGGVKGIAHVGALASLEAHGYELQRISGTSAGAIAGSLAAAGVGAAALAKLMRSVEYPRFRDGSLVERIPLVGPGLAVLLSSGVYEGDYFHEWLAQALAAAGVETWADLRISDPRLDDDHAYRLVVTVADLTRGELVRLPWDYRRLYGLDPDRQLVADAVRASISIPFFFQPVTLRHADGSSSTLVDGGVLSDFPIDTFDRSDGLPPQWPTFGIKLIPQLPARDMEIFPLLGRLKGGPLHLLESLIATLIAGHDQTYLDHPWVRARTVFVDTQAVHALDFNISADQQQLLYDNAFTATQRFLDGWDWEAYLRRFRVPPR
ncbi:MAG: patatin-like phospholipase family protein [Solirubrobacteraceae bacterium]